MNFLQKEPNVGSRISLVPDKGIFGTKQKAALGC